MAFLKFANAVVQNPINLNRWNDMRAAAVGTEKTQATFNKTASLNLSEYSPDNYLLTHCTIIASVDVDDVPAIKTGETESEDGQKIKRLWSDYHITPDTSKYVNQNGDAWERKLLAASFRTFIGAENYVEHVQIPELSKGKVVDAVARDLGDTVYVDILVATDRRHKELVADIESGKMSALSMGCSIQYSVCTKCGNVAADDTELCSHVRYQKGNTFIDHSGKKRVIAELCGHHTDPESVTFIEASWVANPAFKGAVMRNILNPTGDQTPEERAATATQYQQLIESSPMLAEFLASQNMDSFIRNATVQDLDSLRQLQSDMRQVFASAAEPTIQGPTIQVRAFGFDDEEDESAPAEDKGLLEEVKDDVKDQLRDDLAKELKKEIADALLKKKEPSFTGPPEVEDVNDNIVQSYQVFSDRYASELSDKLRLRRVFNVIRKAKTNGWSRVRVGGRYGNEDIVAAMYLRDRDFKRDVLSSELYSCLPKVGGTQNYANVKSFLNACSLAMGRNPTLKEAKSLIKRAKYLK